MNKLHEVVNTILNKEKAKLKTSTFDVRKTYLNQLAEQGDRMVPKSARRAR